MRVCVPISTANLLGSGIGLLYIAMKWQQAKSWPCKKKKNPIPPGGEQSAAPTRPWVTSWDWRDFPSLALFSFMLFVLVLKLVQSLCVV